MDGPLSDIKNCKVNEIGYDLFEYGRIIVRVQYCVSLDVVKQLTAEQKPYY